MSGRVQSVAVVGRDASLWLAAAALRRALGSTGVRVQAVELDSRLAEVDVHPAVPPLAAMHRLLGLDERLVLNVCHAVPMVGQRFSNWAKGAPPFMLAYDDEPPPGGDLPFAQYWAKGALEGLRVGLEEFSPGSACARLNNVPVRGEEPSPLAASYGYHLDAPAYSELVKQLALRLGVEVATAGVRGIDAESDCIAGMDLADGTRLTADLYIDASGREARLIGRMASADFESWAEWLPCDRMLAASAPRLPRLPAYSQISAFHGGWIGLFPLQSRTPVLAVYNSKAVGDGEVAELAAVIARMPIGGDAVVSELRPGIQRRPWIGNCIAVGEAAIAVDPIDAVELQTTHGCISHLMSVFPATAGDYPEAEAYNLSVTRFGRNLRDFQAAHYLLNRRFDDRFWDTLRESALPPGLRRKVDMFGARAAVPLNDDESFNEQIWAALLLGCGVMPEAYDPRVDSAPDEEHVGRVQQRLRSVAEIARRMPSVEQFLGLDQAVSAQVGA
ncbi:MAG TPA: tryptophan 7-halogenase [Sphingomicrobium sp.]|nr:tryptophan 7-halogenase [Sphingomicrobium sp.]